MSNPAVPVELVCKPCGQILLSDDLSPIQIEKGWECPNCGSVNHGNGVALG